MEHWETLGAWILVGKQIYWFMRWPLLCTIWMIVGDSNDTRTETEHAIIGFVALLWTIVVANVVVMW
jgi:hypothetical protein